MTNDTRKPKTYRISEQHSAEIPKARVLARGAAALSDAELLSLFATSLDVDKARALLATHGPMRALLERTPAELAALPGMGESGAVRLSAALELSERYMASALERGEALENPSAAGRYIATKLRPYPYEVFAVMFLDSRHRLLGFEELFRGTVDGAEVHPCEVVRRALAHNAAAVILGHNHPSGSAEPSAADRAVTARLKQALSLVDVRLLDHFVVGDGSPVSLAARGWV